MPDTGVEVVQRMYDASRSGDVETLTRVFDDDVLLDDRARIDGARGRGRDRLIERIGSWIASFDDWHEEIEALRAVDGSVVAIATQTGTAREIGVPVTTRYGVVYEIGDGRITSMTLCSTPAEALALARKG